MHSKSCKLKAETEKWFVKNSSISDFFVLLCNTSIWSCNKAAVLL